MTRECPGIMAPQRGQDRATPKRQAGDGNFKMSDLGHGKRLLRKEMLPKFGEIPCLGHQLAGDQAAPAPRPMVVIHWLTPIT